MNLLAETVHVLATHNLTGADVLWVGSCDGQYAESWEEFATAATVIEYDDGFGGQEIHAALVVVGDDWWLERGEYDGSEWWAFKRRPTRGEGYRSFSARFDKYAVPSQFGIWR